MNSKRAKRQGLEPVDLMAAVGIVATMGGALLFFLATEGEFQVRPVLERNHSKLGSFDSKDWVQPAIGATLADIALLEQRSADKASQAVRQLQQVTSTDQVVRNSVNARLQHAVERINREREDKSARVEFVKGRSIVASTARVKKHNSLPESQWSAYNGRMIDLAAQAGDKIERNFHTVKESRMGDVLTAETESQTRAVRESQERVGAAIVRVAMIEYDHRAAQEAAQEQVGSLLSATTRIEL